VWSVVTVALYIRSPWPNIDRDRRYLSTTSRLRLGTAVQYSTGRETPDPMCRGGSGTKDVIDRDEQSRSLRRSCMSSIETRQSCGFRPRNGRSKGVSQWQAVRRVRVRRAQRVGSLWCLCCLSVAMQDARANSAPRLPSRCNRRLRTVDGGSRSGVQT